MDILSGLQSNTFDTDKFRIFCSDLLLKKHISPRENHAFMVILTGLLVSKQLKHFFKKLNRKITFNSIIETNFGKLLLDAKSQV